IESMPDRRWHTRFGSWVQAYTVARLVRDMAAVGCMTTRPSIYQWVAGATSPRPPNALALERLSAGALTLHDIYEQRSRMGDTPSPSPAPGPAPAQSLRPTPDGSLQGGRPSG